MEANVAPEKIYLIRNISISTSLNTTNDCYEKYLQEWYKGREKDTDIEYIRTDAFIEKACEWIREFNNHHYIMRYSDSCEPPLSEVTEWFKNYMEGE